MRGSRAGEGQQQTAKIKNAEKKTLLNKSKVVSKGRKEHFYKLVASKPFICKSICYAKNDRAKSGTGECVSSFVGQVPDSINDGIFRGKRVEMPLNPGISTVLSQT